MREIAAMAPPKPAARARLRRIGRLMGVGLSVRCFVGSGWVVRMLPGMVWCWWARVLRTMETRPAAPSEWPRAALWE
jgi:hypothetical protein